MRVANKFLVLSSLLLSLAAAAMATTITIATGANTSLAAAQLISQPDLIINQAAPNYSLANTQPVSPQYYAALCCGRPRRGNAGHTPGFFSLSANAGQNISMRVSSTGSAQATELLLYDPHGKLVAIAAGNGADGLSSDIQFTVPNGDGGHWVTEVTSSPNANPATDLFNYDLRVASPISYSTDVLGALNNPNDPGFYAINAQVGDALDLTATATSPLGGPDELLLYDPNGNLVAVAAGNAPDGVSSAIQFTVPQGDPGNWVAEVAGSPNVNPNTNLFDYDLNIKGATGAGPISPLPLASAPEPKYAPLVGFLLALGAVVHRRRVSAGR